MVSTGSIYKDGYLYTRNRTVLRTYGYDQIYRLGASNLRHRQSEGAAT